MNRYNFRACDALRNVHIAFSSFFFFRKKHLLMSCATSVRPSVCPSVEINFFRDNSLSNKPIDLIISLNVCEEVVHVQMA